MIEHDASNPSGSGAGRPGFSAAGRRHPRSLALGCLLVVLAVGGVFWRQLAIGWCFCVARVSSDPATIDRSCHALVRLGPQSLPALVRLVDRPELHRMVSAGAAMGALYDGEPQANAPIHDLLLSTSPRARAMTGAVLVMRHDATGLPAVLEGLRADDPDVRFLSAYALTSMRCDRFEKEVRDAPRVFQRVVSALAEALVDPRPWGPTTIGELARTCLEALDPTFVKKDARDAALAGDAKAVFEEARARRGVFFQGDGSEEHR